MMTMKKKMEINEMDDNKSNKIKSTKAMGVFSIFTSFSRILGFIREVLKSYVFGTGPLSVAFDIAFRIPNMLRALIAEGAMTQAFVPVYNQYKKNQDANQMSHAVGFLLSYLTVFLVFLSIVAYFIIPYIIPFIIDSTFMRVDQIELIILLTQILFPYIIFMSLSSVYMALEYSNGIFWSGAFGPALLNIVSILGYILYLWIGKVDINNITKTDIYVFAWVTLLASLIQLIFQVLVVRHSNLSPIFSFKSHPLLKDMLLLMIPSLFSVGMQQMSQLVDIYQASSLQNKVPEAISALTYAQRVIQLPMGIFGVALSTAFLSSFSRLYSENKEEEFADTVFFALRLNLFFLLPASIGIGIFSSQVISLLFERGNFNTHATEVTSYALQYYAPGLVAYGMQKVLVSSLFARKKVWILSIVTGIALLLNAFLNYIFMKYIYHGGIALGSSLAAFSVCAMFLFILRKKLPMAIFMQNGLGFIKIISINIILWITMYSVNKVFYISVISLLPTIMILISFYFLLCIVFKCEEISYFKSALMKKMK